MEWGSIQVVWRGQWEQRCVSEGDAGEVKDVFEFASYVSVCTPPLLLTAHSAGWIQCVLTAQTPVGSAVFPNRLPLGWKAIDLNRLHCRIRSQMCLRQKTPEQIRSFFSSLIWGQWAWTQPTYGGEFTFRFRCIAFLGRTQRSLWLAVWIGHTRPFKRQGQKMFPYSERSGQLALSVFPKCHPSMVRSCLEKAPLIPRCAHGLSESQYGSLGDSENQPRNEEPLMPRQACSWQHGPWSWLCNWKILHLPWLSDVLWSLFPVCLSELCFLLHLVWRQIRMDGDCGSLRILLGGMFRNSHLPPPRPWLSWTCLTLKTWCGLCPEANFLII